jgi:hypothetical protein
MPLEESIKQAINLWYLLNKTRPGLHSCRVRVPFPVVVVGKVDGNRSESEKVIEIGSSQLPSPGPGASIQLLA